MWYFLGRLRGLDLPVMRSMITLASAMLGEDYFETGNTLASLGLDGMSAEELEKIFGAPVEAPRELRPASRAIPLTSPCRPTFRMESGLLGLLAKQNPFPQLEASLQSYGESLPHHNYIN